MLVVFWMRNVQQQQQPQNLIHLRLTVSSCLFKAAYWYDQQPGRGGDPTPYHTTREAA